MNPRELLARLNVPAVRYELGRGGIPELTNIDIAGALGMVKNEFAVEVFCAIWWPDGAKLSRVGVGRLIYDRIMDEYAKRQRAIAAAKLDLNIAEGEAVQNRTQIRYDEGAVGACKRMVDITKARHWPFNPHVYARIGNTVIDERRFPARCTSCQGRSELIIDSKLVKCETCHGTGIRNRPVVWRATQMGISDKAFAQSWTGIYDWAARLVADAESQCAHALRDALMREDTVTS
jgi:hypothetical protein